MGTALEIVIEIITFAVVVAVSLAAERGLFGFLTVRRRLGVPGTAETAAGGPVVKDQTVRNPLLRWVESSTSLNDSQERQKLIRDLSAAGFEGAAMPVFYVIIRFSLAIGLPVVFIFSQGLFGKPITGFMLILITLGLCGVGLVAPRAFIDNRAKARNDQLEREFPDALDLMVVCVEAGLGIEAAFIKVATEVKESHPRIGEEFDRVSQEFRAGQGRADALRAMADRTTVSSVRSFVALLIQTDTLGTSIGQTLRTYATEMRAHRFLNAEEKAMRIPVLMTIPLVACILPVIIVALLLPPMIDVMRTVAPLLTGHYNH
jgi:tight adherence protein C